MSVFFRRGFYHGSTAVPHRAPPFRGCRCVFLGIGILPRALFYALSAQFADGLHAGGHYHFLLRLHPDAGAHSAGHFHRHHGCIQKNHHRRPFLHHSQQPWPVFDHEFCGHSAVSYAGRRGGLHMDRHHCGVHGHVFRGGKCARQCPPECPEQWRQAAGLWAVQLQRC